MCAAATAAAGCAYPSLVGPTAVTPRLTTPTPTSVLRIGAGIHRVAFGAADLVAYLPPRALALSRIPVMLFLHGALRTVEIFVDGHRAAADATGVCVVAPYATYGTWDAIGGSYGRDINVLDATLRWLYENVPVNPERVGLSGFSDGASYTLGIGRANGDLFTRLIAYSPGMLLDGPRTGTPPIVISHGTEDSVLSFDYSRGVIVPRLREEGYQVEFRSFVGPHAVPSSVMTEQMSVLAG